MKDSLRGAGAFVERGVARAGGYNADADRRTGGRRLVATLALGGATVVFLTSTTALLYKRGYLHRLATAAGVSPAAVERVDAAATRLAELTEPPAAARVAGVKEAKAHMRRVYGKATAAFALSFAGTHLFFAVPQLPLGPAIALTALPTFVVGCVPRRYVNRGTRLALFGAAAFGAGVVGGPLNWVAADSMQFVACAVAGSAIGFTAATEITRGVVSYFVVSQALSASTALLLATAVARAGAAKAEGGATVAASEAAAALGRMDIAKQAIGESTRATTAALGALVVGDTAGALSATSAAFSAFGALTGAAARTATKTAAPLLRQRPPPVVDADGVLGLQAVGNIALALLHAGPCIWRATMVDQRGEGGGAADETAAQGTKDAAPDEAATPVSRDQNSPDDIGEALIIFGSVAYAVWYLFRHLATTVARRVVGAAPPQHAADVRRRAGDMPNATDAARDWLRVNERHTSEAAASVAFALLYLRFVKAAQRSGDGGAAFDAARKLFSVLAPVHLID